MKHQNEPWHSVGVACALLTGCSTAGYAQYADSLWAAPQDPSTTVVYPPPPPNGCRATFRIDRYYWR